MTILNYRGENMADTEKVIKEFEAFVNGHCPSDFKHVCHIELMETVLALLKEQKEEIAFLKAMQLQTVKNMNKSELGSVVKRTMDLFR